MLSFSEAIKTYRNYINIQKETRKYTRQRRTIVGIFDKETLPDISNIDFIFSMMRKPDLRIFNFLVQKVVDESPDNKSSIAISQKDLSKILNIPRETINRALKNFEICGYITRQYYSAKPCRYKVSSVFFKFPVREKLIKFIPALQQDINNNK